MKLMPSASPARTPASRIEKRTAPATASQICSESYSAMMEPTRQRVLGPRHKATRRRHEAGPRTRGPPIHGDQHQRLAPVTRGVQFQQSPLGRACLR